MRDPHSLQIWYCPASIMTCIVEQIELQAKLLNYFLGSNKSNINQSLPVICILFSLLHFVLACFRCVKEILFTAEIKWTDFIRPFLWLAQWSNPSHRIDQGKPGPKRGGVDCCRQRLGSRERTKDVHVLRRVKGLFAKRQWRKRLL